MSPLQLGTTLLRKYRIDRVRLESHDAILYEATDTTHDRRVCIKVLLRDRLESDEARDANVIDIGRTTGLPYVVTGEFPRSAEPPALPILLTRRTSKPPPLPPRRSPPPPPPLLPPRLPEVEVPIFVSEPLPVETSDVELPRELRRSSKWPWAIAFAAALTGALGWFIGQRESHPAPATIAIDPAPPPTSAPATVQPNVTEPSPASTTEKVVEAPKPARRKPATDPLTL